MADSQELESDPTIDIDASSDRIGDMLGEFAASEPEQPVTPEVEAADLTATTDQPVLTPQETAALEVPKSWKKEMHPHWSKMPREAQQYYIEREEQMLNGLKQYQEHAGYAKPFLDVLQPYQHLFVQRKPHEMVRDLFNAHQLLTNGTQEQRRKYYEELGRNLGLTPAQAAATDGQPQPVADPMIQQIQQELSSVKEALTAQQKAAYDAAYKETSKTVESFAADTKAHPYFNEVADDILGFIGQGLSLQDAYDRAVWANPAVREKEKARLLTEEQAKWKENARLASLPKKKAAGVNVRSQESGRTPTEPLGSLEDTIREVNREIRARAS